MMRPGVAPPCDPACHTLYTEVQRARSWRPPGSCPAGSPAGWWPGRESSRPHADVLVDESVFDTMGCRLPIDPHSAVGAAALTEKEGAELMKLSRRQFIKAGGGTAARLATAGV